MLPPARPRRTCLLGWVILWGAVLLPARPRRTCLLGWVILGWVILGPARARFPMRVLACLLAPSEPTPAPAPWVSGDDGVEGDLGRRYPALPALPLRAVRRSQPPEHAYTRKVRHCDVGGVVLCTVAWAFRHVPVCAAGVHPAVLFPGVYPILGG